MSLEAISRNIKNKNMTRNSQYIFTKEKAGVQHSVVKIVKGLEHMICKKGLREMGFFSLEKRRLRWDLIARFSDLLGGYR